MTDTTTGKQKRSPAAIISIVLALASLVMLFPSLTCAGLFYVADQVMDENFALSQILPIELDAIQTASSQNGDFEAKITIVNEGDRTYTLDFLDISGKNIGRNINVTESSPKHYKESIEAGSYQELYFSKLKLKPDEKEVIKLRGNSSSENETLQITVYAEGTEMYKSELLRIRGSLDD